MVLELGPAHAGGLARRAGRIAQDQAVGTDTPGDQIAHWALAKISLARDWQLHEIRCASDVGRPHAGPLEQVTVVGDVAVGVRDEETQLRSLEAIEGLTGRPWMAPQTCLRVIQVLGDWETPRAAVTIPHQESPELAERTVLPR